MSDSALLDTKTPWISASCMPWAVCFSAGLFFLYEFFQLTLFDVINLSLRDEFNLDAAKLSWLSSSYLWANLLFLLPAGMLLDRFSVRRMVLLAMLVCVLGTLGFALTTHFYLAFMFHALTGVGNAFCFLACVVLVSRWFLPRRQAFVVGCIVTMAFIGGMLAHTPLAYLNMHYGWRDALLMDAALGALILMWLAVILKDRPDASHVTHDTTPAATLSFVQAFKNKQTWLAGFYTACLNVPIMVLCVLWGASYLTVVHGLAPLSASNVVSLILIGSIIGCPLAGWLSDKHGVRKPLMMLGASVSLVISVLLVYGSSVSVVYLSFLFFSLGLFSSTQVIGYPVIAESNTEHNTGSATALASLVIIGGGGVAQVVFGLLMQAHAGGDVLRYTVADFQGAMWLFPVTMAAALIAIFFMRETRCTRINKGVM
jgi:MFS family permease